MTARRLLGVAAVLLALAAAASPAAVSRGGQASATGVTAVAGEVEPDVATSGAIGRLSPVVDRLTAGPVELGSVLVVDSVTAETHRVENGVRVVDARVLDLALAGALLVAVGARTVRRGQNGKPNPADIGTDFVD